MSNAQFKKNGLTVVQKTKVLSLSPSRALMSLEKAESYGKLMRNNSGDHTVADHSLNGSHQHSLLDLNQSCSPINMQAPTIVPTALGGMNDTGSTLPKDNRDIAGLDLTKDQLGLTFFTSGTR